MKKIITILFCIFIFAVAQAQSGKSSKPSHSAGTLSSGNFDALKLGWGESNKIENEDALSHETVFGDMNNGIFSVRMQHKKLIFAKYTDDLKLSIEKELLLPAPKGGKMDDLIYKTAIYLKGIIYVAMVYYDKNAETGYLYFCKISDDGVPDNKLIEMDKIVGFKRYMTTGKSGEEDDLGLYGGYSIWGGLEQALKSPIIENGFRAILSSDSSKLLIYHHATADNKDMERFACTVTDANLKPLWSKTIELPYLNKDFDITSLKVDNDGDCVFVGTKKLEGDEKTGKAKADYRMAAYYWQDKQIKEFTFDLGDKMINDLYFTFDKDNNIRVGGFYTNKRSDRTDGYFYTTIDKATKTIGTKIVNDLEADFADKFKFATKKGELKNFTINNIYSSANGNLILIAEQREIEEVRAAGPGMNGMGGSYYNAGGEIFYLSNDILVFCLKPNGDLIWSTTVPKKQRMTSRDYESYIFLHDNDNLYFLYNDNPENANLDREKVSTYRNKNKTAIMLATITADGKVTRKEIPQPEENEDHLALKIKLLADVGEKNFALVGRASGQYRMGIVKIK